MRHLSLLWMIMAILSFSSCKKSAEPDPLSLSDGSFVVIGTTDSIPDGTRLSIIADGQDKPLASVNVKDGQFQFNGSSKDLSIFMVYKSLAKSDPCQQMFFAKNGDTVRVHLSTQLGMSRVSGTVVNDDFQMISDSAQSHNQRLIKVFDQYGDNPSDAQKREIEKIVEEEKGHLTSLIYKVAEKHADNEFGYFIITQPFDFTDAQRMALIMKMPKEYRERELIKDLEKAISSTGKKFPDFTINDLNGTPISLSDVIKLNKYTLIDFWASWCAPCMQEMPHMVQLYEIYKDKGLGFIGISLDKDKDAWKKAVADFHADWTQVSELKDWNSKPVQELGITAIPHTIIVDNSGKIIAQGLTGVKLEEFIRYLELGE